MVEHCGKGIPFHGNECRCAFLERTADFDRQLPPSVTGFSCQPLHVGDRWLPDPRRHRSTCPMLHTESVDGWRLQVGARRAFAEMQGRDQWISTTIADARSNKMKVFCAHHFGFDIPCLLRDNFCSHEHQSLASRAHDFILKNIFGCR